MPIFKLPAPHLRPALALRILTLAWLSQIWISQLAWLPGLRDFPRAPLLPGFASVELETLGLFAVGLGMAGILWKPEKYGGVSLLLSGMALLVLMDVNRLQPWVFVYGLVMAGILAIGLLTRGESTPNSKDSDLIRQAGRKLSLIRIVIACTWFWSGVMKMNPAFAGDYFPGLVEPFGLGEWALAHPVAAYAAGSLEALAGILFALPRAKKLGLVAGLLVHAFILASLGPWGLNWNEVVWSWNLAFMALAVLSLTPKNYPHTSKSISKQQKSSFLNSWLEKATAFLKPKYLPELAVLLLAGILPLLNLFGHWDHFLSHSYYSARAPAATFYFHPDDRFSIPESARPYVLQVPGEDEFLIPLELWALGELKIPGYPELRTRMQTSKSLCKCLSHPEKAGLRTIEKQGFSSTIISDTVACSSLLRISSPPQHLTIQ